MRVAARAVAAVALVGVACARFWALGVPSDELPLTRAEASGFTETSRYADVLAFLDSLRTLGAPISVGAMGTSAGGHEIPYVIASRPLVRDRAEAVRARLPIVYVQANIHGGEVEGKEALLMLLRDLLFSEEPNALDSLVLIAVPIYNVDGNEAFGAQETNRPEQNGPAVVGRRSNAAGLDLNRDYIKAEAPETQATLRMLAAWGPHVFVDLHTTNGSLHGYALTYSPPLNPASLTRQLSRDWLDTLRNRVRERHGFETFDYGNFGTDDTPWRERAVHTPEVNAWSTFDHRPRFSTNYAGLRPTVAILSEAYSHDPFERRVRSTYAFLQEILSLVAEPGSRETVELALEVAGRRTHVPVRSRMTRQPRIAPVLVEVAERTGDSIRREPGLAPGIRRTGRFLPVTMPVFDEFIPVAEVPLPARYVIPAQLGRVIELLMRHGGIPGGLVEDGKLANVGGGLQEFIIDSISRAPHPFEGHNEVRITGRWVESQYVPAAKDVVVLLDSLTAPLFAYLLDPESDDGLVTWNFLDEQLKVGDAYPIRRLAPRAR